MTEIMKSDIFFVVSTGAVVAVTLFLIVALIYLIKILRNAQKLSERAREEGEALLQGVGQVRGNLVRFITGLFARKKKK
jgi:hypothetical protein